MILKKEAVVIHSGGMDSSLCLAVAIREFGVKSVVSLSFSYNQRHSNELIQAKKICSEWGVDHYIVNIESLRHITSSALMDSTQTIMHLEGEAPNTLVVGRNGLMARLGAIYAHSMGARCLYMGVIEVESANSGYRDCSRKYMEMMQEILRIDLDDAMFEIRTPVVYMTKKETMELGKQLGVLEFLLKETITCYEGIPEAGCGVCPACKLRNEGLREFIKENPHFKAPYPVL
jgi:7-cyano-7-deazaguanine synthase